MSNPELISRSVYYQLTDVLDISAIYYHEGRLILRARLRYPDRRIIELVVRRMKASGFEAGIKEDAEGLLIGIKEADKSKVPWLNLVLFLATLGTVFLAQPGPVAFKIEYAVALMTILLFHEFGHYLAGRRRGILMSLPYFIPMVPRIGGQVINLIGTFGAVIRSRSPFANRRDLIEVGAAGPVAGFVISVVALAVGLGRSPIVPEGMMPIMFIEGDSLLTAFLKAIVVGPIPEGYDLMLAPTAFAGWVGLVVTMINLLPLGQLDGGHIIYGLIGPRQHVVSMVFLGFIAVLGFWWPGWWLFGALIFLFRIRHQPTLNDMMKVPLSTRLLAGLAIIIFIISFVPIPITMG